VVVGGVIYPNIVRILHGSLLFLVAACTATKTFFCPSNGLSMNMFRLPMRPANLSRHPAPPPQRKQPSQQQQPLL
jgi:hypothetical protein